MRSLAPPDRTAALRRRVAIAAMAVLLAGVVLIPRTQGAQATLPTVTDDMLHFDGVDDYMNLGPLDVAGSQMTIEAWIKSEDLTNCSHSDCRIISKARGTANYKHHWMLSTINVGGEPRLRFRLRTGHKTKALIASSGDLDDDRWYHVAAVYDGSRMRLYLDGIEVGSVAKRGLIARDSRIATWIGANPAAPPEKTWSGQIDEVRIWNRALTAEQLNASMLDRPVGTEQGLVAYYPFDSHDPTADLAGGNRGTLGSSTSSDVSDPRVVVAERPGRRPGSILPPPPSPGEDSTTTTSRPPSPPTLREPTTTSTLPPGVGPGDPKKPAPEPPPPPVSTTAPNLPAPAPPPPSVSTTAPVVTTVPTTERPTTTTTTQLTTTTAVPVAPPPDSGGSVSHGSQLLASNTGLRAAGYVYNSSSDTFSHPVHGALRQSGSITSEYDGQVIENVDVTGTITIKHDNVTVRNCRVRYNGTVKAVNARTDRPAGTVIEYCDIHSVGSNGTKAIGLYLANGTSRWNNLSGWRTAVMVGADVRVEYTRVTEPKAESGTHGNAMSAEGGSNVVFYRNYMLGNTSASLALYARTPFHGVLVQDNFFDAGRTPSFCLNAGSNKEGEGVNTNIQIVGNRFGTSRYPDCGQYGPQFNFDSSRPGALWCDNSFVDGRIVGSPTSSC